MGLGRAQTSAAAQLGDSFAAFFIDLLAAVEFFGSRAAMDKYYPRVSIPVIPWGNLICVVG